MKTRRLPEKIMNVGFQNHMDVILSEAEHGCESERKPRMINFFSLAIERLNEFYFDSIFLFHKIFYGLYLLSLKNSIHLLIIAFISSLVCL
jgi:hypothetical protein